MSAYIVSRNCIRYLLSTARDSAGMEAVNDEFYWYHDGETHYIENFDAVGQMLWDENLASVEHLYSREKAAELPGHPTDGALVYTHDTGMAEWYHWDPVQALMTIDHYAYQCCEHPGWRESSAFAFVQTLKSKVIRLLPGYEQSTWGAPEPADSEAMPPSLLPASSAMPADEMLRRIQKICEAGGVPTVNLLRAMQGNRKAVAAKIDALFELEWFDKTGVNVVDQSRIDNAIERAQEEGDLDRDLTDYERRRIAVRVGEIMRDEEWEPAIESMLDGVVQDVATGALR